MCLELTDSPNPKKTGKKTQSTTKTCGLQETLSKDVLGNVLDYVTRNRDFKTLCLTSKTLYHLILPRFYRKFIIPVNDITSDKFSSLVQPDNKGLPLIREITIYPWGGAWKKRENVEFMENLFKALRKGQLDAFHIRSTVGMPSSLTKLLWTTQPHLKNVDLFTKRDHVHDLGKPEEPLPFPNLVQVRIVPENEAALQTASKSLRGLTHCKLHINGSHLDSKPATIDNSTGNVTYALPEALCQSTDARTAGSRWDGLKGTTFTDVDFRFCRKTWLRYWDLSNLRSLQLHHCQGVETLLEELMADGAPQLTEFCVTHDLGEDDPDDIMEVLNRFLTSIKGRLRRLEIVLRNTPLPVSPKAVNVHAETIRLLVLDIMRTTTDERSHYEWTPAQLKRMLTGCDNLTQFALGLPSSYVEYPDFDLTDSHGDFSRALRMIFEHTDPVVLNILTWPEDFEWDRPNRPGPKAKRTLIERLAGDIFNTAASLPRADLVRRRRRLDLIAFGVYETVSSRQPWREYFIRADTWASTGWYQTGAVVAHCFHCLRSEGMEIEIFEHDIREWDGEKRAEADVDQRGSEDEGETGEEGGGEEQAGGDELGGEVGQASGRGEADGEGEVDVREQNSGLDEAGRQDDSGEQGRVNALEQTNRQDDADRPDEARGDGEVDVQEPVNGRAVSSRPEDAARGDDAQEGESTPPDESGEQTEIDAQKPTIGLDRPALQNESGAPREGDAREHVSEQDEPGGHDPLESQNFVEMLETIAQDLIGGQVEVDEEDEVRNLMMIGWPWVHVTEAEI